MDYALYPTFRARLEARAKIRQRRKEVVELMAQLDTDLKAYLKIFNRAKNFSNEDWRELIRKPERYQKLLETLKMSCNRFRTEINKFESYRRHNYHW